MLDRNIFGSTLSLGGLLNDNLFSDGEADQFLQEMGVQTAPGAGELATAETHSGANSFESTVSGMGGTEDFLSHTEQSSEAFPGLFPTLNSASTQPQDLPQKTSQNIVQPASSEGAQQGLAILGQLLTALGAAALPPAPKQPETLPPACYAAAFKSPTEPAQQFCTVPQLDSQQSKTGGAKLPNLNAHQQQALQTIMDFGQLGTTKEGKKVRRMLSNRESARRSRHRKQAHVVEIEEKVHRVEAENEAMKAALARAAEQETRSVEERTRLYTEIAALRTKLDHMEQAQAKLIGSAAGNSNKRGASQSSTQGAVSTDSCCDSLPSKRMRTTASGVCHACKILQEA